MAPIVWSIWKLDPKFWEGVGGTGLLEKICPWGKGLKLKSSSSLELTALALMPATYCHASHRFLAKIRKYVIVKYM